MGLPPWANSSTQLFAMVTGCNSGLGYSICERMTDEFLSSSFRPIDSHLVLVVSTRTPAKTHETIVRLRKHLRKVSGRKEVTKRQTPEQAVARVHFLGVELDLCDLRSVYDAADLLNNGEIDSSSEDGLRGVKIPRLDILVMNAGIGGWTGVHWPSVFWLLFTDTLHSVTWPPYKIAKVGAVTKPQRTAKMLDGQQEPLGEVFCANLFGHYILGHELMPLLSRAEGRDHANPRGRIVWMSSIEATDEYLNLDDFQGLKSTEPYESVKRITDIMSLTASLPSIAPISQSWFDVGDQKSLHSKAEEELTVRPRMYLAHPGICATSIIPIHIILQVLQMISFYFIRYIGGVWHPTTSYNGACAPVWLALTDQRILDDMEGYPEEAFDHDVDEKPAAPSRASKWGSSTNWLSFTRARRTVLDGWGWTGVVGEDIQSERSVMRKRRKDKPAGDLTEEDRERFEYEGREVWKQLESLRRTWEGLLFWTGESEK